MLNSPIQTGSLIPTSMPYSNEMTICHYQMIYKLLTKQERLNSSPLFENRNPLDLIRQTIFQPFHKYFTLSFVIIK